METWSVQGIQTHFLREWDRVFKLFVLSWTSNETQDNLRVRSMDAALDLSDSLLFTLMNVVDIILTYKLQHQFSCSFPQCTHRTVEARSWEAHACVFEWPAVACSFPGCNYKAKQAKCLMNHKTVVHDPARVKDKECTFCAEKFFTDNNLRTHIEAHRDEKPYSCPYPNCNVRRVSTQVSDQGTRDYSQKREKCPLWSSRMQFQDKKCN